MNQFCDLGFENPPQVLIFKDRMDTLSSCLTWHLVAKWLSAFEVGPNMKLDILRAICAQLKIYILAAPRTSEFEQICTFAGMSLIEEHKVKWRFFHWNILSVLSKSTFGELLKCGRHPPLKSSISRAPIISVWPRLQLSSQFGQDCPYYLSLAKIAAKPNQIR